MNSNSQQTDQSITQLTDPTQASVAECLRKHLREFTPSEIRIANHLLGNYPMAGLVSITELSEAAGVSTPTVMRTLKKIGHHSFTTFQKALKDELQKTLSDPIAKHEQWAGDAPEGHVLNRLADTVVVNLRHTLNQSTHETFDAIVNLLCDTDQALHVVGGRITRTFAAYLSTHLEIIREQVFEFPSNHNLWPQHLLKLKAGDVVLIFDVRRYEQDLAALSQIALARGARIVLITDQWLSPINARATYTLPIKIEGYSGWDSGLGILFFVEALILALEERLWASTAERVRDLESMFSLTGCFKRLMP